MDDTTPAEQLWLVEACHDGEWLPETPFPAAVEVFENNGDAERAADALARLDSLITRRVVRASESEKLGEMDGSLLLILRPPGRQS